LPDAASLIARALYDAGCRHAFGIPGGEVLAIMDALENAGIAFHLCKHENAGGFMAEGTHHATKAPGILLATIGPGLANGLNVVINALQDQVPLIVISGCVDRAEAATYTHQIFDQQQVMRPLTKASLMMADGAVDIMIAKAIAIARADPPGPVHIDIPVDLAAREQPPARRYGVAKEAPVGPAPGPALAAARAHLASARRPLMVAGLGVLHHDCAALTAEVCERFGIALITSYKAKGILPEDHPLALGGHGLSPIADRHLMPLFDNADLVLAVGYDPIEMRVGWRDPWDPAKTIELVHFSNRHGMHGASVSFVGDIGASLLALTQDVPPQPATWADGRCAAARAALKAHFAPRGQWGAHQAFAVARQVSPANTIVTVDSGAHRILFSEMWEAAWPHTVLQSTGLCTMGTALPLAIGYKLANREAPVLAIMGDAGLEMVLGELATLRDLRLPVAILVMVDRQLGLIELKQRHSGYASLGVEMGATDFPAVAEAMGGRGVAIHDGASLAAELAQAHARDSFTLMACVIGPKAYDGAF